MTLTFLLQTSATKYHHHRTSKANSKVSLAGGVGNSKAPTSSVYTSWTWAFLGGKKFPRWKKFPTTDFPKKKTKNRLREPKKTVKKFPMWAKMVQERESHFTNCFFYQQLGGFRYEARQIDKSKNLQVSLVSSNFFVWQLERGFLCLKHSR